MSTPLFIFRWLVLPLMFLVMITPPTAAQGTPPTDTGEAGINGAATLQPGDVIRIDIWREPDLSGDFAVDLDGVVIFPLLGETRVTGIPMRQLRTMLIEEYRVHLRNPSINITPLRRVHVFGEVNRPGAYEIDPTASLIGVVALADGPTSSGNLRRIQVVRDGQVIHDRVALQASLNGLGIRSGDQILVGQRSWLARNTSLVTGVLLALPSVIYTITLIRRS